MDQKEIQLYYFRTSDIWKKFCESHNTLYELTCTEYSFLLKNDIDNVDKILDEKNNTIREINSLETLRSETIKELSLKLGQKIDSSSDLLMYFKTRSEIDFSHLESFNNLLIEIIEKIQSQNKTNQIFITKYLRHLREIKSAAVGEKNFDVYNKKGAMKALQK